MSQSQEQLETLLSDYVDGNLTGDELAAVESYLEKNPALRDTVNRLMIDSEALRSIPRVNAPFDFSEDVRGQLERDLLLDSGSMAFPRRRQISSLVATAAATLVIVAGLGGAAYWLLANRPTPFIDVALHTPSAPTPGVAESAGAEELANAEREAKTEADAKAEEADKDALATALVAREGREDRSSAAEFRLPTDGGVPGGNAGAGGPLLTAPTVTRTVEPKEAPATYEIQKAMRRRAPLSQTPPAELAQLVDEAPRYNRRAVAIVIDPHLAPAANEAVTNFFAQHPVRVETLSYDATRNRAVGGTKVSQDALANTGGMQQQLGDSQVSGVISNAAVSPITQAMQPAAPVFAESVPEPQVVMAVGLTQAQLETLQDSLSSDLGDSQPAAYELGSSDLNLSAQRFKGDYARDASTTTDVPSSSPASRPAFIAAGDHLRITVTGVGPAKADHEVVVDADGEIYLADLGVVRAEGMTLQALRQSMLERFISERQLRDVVVDVELIAPKQAATNRQADSRAQQAPARPDQPRTQAEQAGAHAGRAEGMHDSAVRSNEPVATTSATQPTDERSTVEALSTGVGGTVPAGEPELIDVFLVVKAQEPSTQPATPANTPEPTTQPRE